MSDTILAGDWTVYYAAENNQKRLEWTGSATGTTTVNALYSALQSLFDDSAQMDDEDPMKADTPDIYRMINDWFIDDTSVEHLTGGALFSDKWKDGTTEHVLILGYAQTTEFSLLDVGRTIEGQTTFDTGTILDFNTGRGKVWIRPDDPASGGDEFDNGTESYIVFLDAIDSCKIEDATGGPSFADETTDINSAAANDVLLLPAGGAAVNDAAYFGFGQQFSELTLNIGTAGIGTYTLTWEYWNGAWVALGGVTDNTTDFKTTTTNTVVFTSPTDWLPTTVDGEGPIFWIRARVDAGTRTTDPLGTQGWINGKGAGAFDLASVGGESSWSGITTIGTIETNTHIYINQDDPDTALFQDSNLVVATKGTTDWWGDGQIDILLKTEEADVVIGENPAVAGTPLAQVFGRQATKLYSSFGAALITGGNTVVPLGTADDLNNIVGDRQFTTDAETGGGWSSADVGTVITDDTDPTKQGVITSVSGTGPNYTVQYYLIGDPLTDFINDDIVEDPGLAKDMTVDGAPVAVNAGASPSTTITVVHAGISRDLGNGAGPQPYSIEIDLQALDIQVMYQRLMFLTRRGSVATASTDGQEGQFYLGNELQLEYDNQSGDFGLGLIVTGQTSGAEGTIVADHDDGGTGDLILRNVRGTFQDNEILNDTATGVADILITGGIRTISPVVSAPFGTFAGGVFFGAPGVWLTDLEAGDEQAFQLIDDEGATQIPPNTVSVELTNLIAGDSCFCAEIVSPTDNTVIVNQFTDGGTNVIGDNDYVTDGTIPSDTSPSGKLRVVDVATGREDRYRYSSFTAATFTLAAESTGVSDGGGSDATTIDDTTATFQTDNVEIGDLVRNDTEGVVVRVTGITSETVLTVEASSVATWSGDTYTVNALAFNYTSAVDTAYSPYIDRIADATEESNTIIHSGDINVVFRVRKAGLILPFEQISTIVAAGRSVQTVRSADDIFV